MILLILYWIRQSSKLSFYF